MFNEILRIKPVLDAATTRQMEETLSSRFARVATRFGSGLKSVIKGSFLGISLGLISKLLNPIEALQDKITKLLGEGTDIRDLADRFGTTGGKLKQLQDVAQTLGVSPDQFRDMLTKYAQAVEKGREELQNPFVEPSASTVAVKNFVGEKDLAKGFTQFVTSLKAAGEAAGSDLALSDRAKRLVTQAAAKGQTLSDSEREELISKGELRRRTGLEFRQATEKDVFGDVQHGASKRLIEANISDVAKGIKEPTEDALTARIEKAASLADKRRALDVHNQTEDFVAATDKISGKMIGEIAQADKLALERETKQLDSFNDLKNASIAIEQVKALLIEGNIFISKGIGYLADMSTFISGLKQSRIFRGILGGKGD